MTFKLSLTFEKTLMQVKEAEREKANKSKKKIQQSETDAGECRVYGRMKILKCRSHALNLSKSKYFSQLVQTVNIQNKRFAHFRGICCSEQKAC